MPEPKVEPSKAAFRQGILDRITANETSRDNLISWTCIILLLVFGLRQSALTVIEKVTATSAVLTLLARLFSDVLGVRANHKALDQFDEVLYEEEWPEPVQYKLLKIINWCSVYYFIVTLLAYALTLFIEP